MCRSEAAYGRGQRALRALVVLYYRISKRSGELSLASLPPPTSLVLCRIDRIAPSQLCMYQ